MVLEKLRGLRSEPAFVAQLREHKWTNEQQKRELLEKFQSVSKPDVEWVAWTALDQTPEIRAAGLAIMKRRHDRAGLEAPVPLLKTRQGAVNLLMSFAPELLARRLLEHFRGSFVWVRDRAVETARDGLPGFVNALLLLTKDPDPAFAKAASEMTLALADAKALPVWIKLVDDPDLWVKTRAIETLGRTGRGNDEVLARLLLALKDPDLVIAAASAVGELADARAAQPLLDVFKAAVARPDVQMEILDAMGKLAMAEARVQQQVVTICSRVVQMSQIDQAVRARARRLE